MSDQYRAVHERGEGWFVAGPHGEKVAGPFRNEYDARSEASRRPAEPEYCSVAGCNLIALWDCDDCQSPICEVHGIGVVCTVVCPSCEPKARREAAEAEEEADAEMSKDEDWDGEGGN